MEVPAYKNSYPTGNQYTLPQSTVPQAQKRILERSAEMKFSSRKRILATVLALTGIAFIVKPSLARAEDGDKDDQGALRGRIVAVGIPGASAISPVGVFLPGGPIHDKPALNVFTKPGQVLDPVRIMVASSSNFGEPLARTDQLPGSFLSIDPNGPTLVVPADFASSGGQVSILGGRVL